MCENCMFSGVPRVQGSLKCKPVHRIVICTVVRTVTIQTGLRRASFSRTSSLVKNLVKFRFSKPTGARRRSVHLVAAYDWLVKFDFDWFYSAYQLFITYFRASHINYFTDGVGSYSYDSMTNKQNCLFVRILCRSKRRKFVSVWKAHKTAGRLRFTNCVSDIKVIRACSNKNTISIYPLPHNSTCRDLNDQIWFDCITLLDSPTVAVVLYTISVFD